jgi:acetylornithine deacetylase/succinyl-diaminopimelate desuccinylase-like protein
MAATADVDRALVGEDELAQLCLELTAIPSPTGEEGALAEFVARKLEAEGLVAEVQETAEGVANVVGRLGGGDGPSLMLWAPLDTAVAGGPEDADWIGEEPRPDWSLPPRREGEKVIGLGADNPKAFAASAIAAAATLGRSGRPLRGELVVGLAGGTMPVLRRPGLGAGTRRLLETVTPDFCVVLKPGYAVAHEEVGFAWFRIVVPGAMSYTGIRHKGPYRSPIVAAAKVIEAIEAWLPEYTAANTSGLVAPQGAVNAIRSGDAGVGSFTPMRAELLLDLRISPRGSVEEAQAGLEKLLAEHEPTVELVASVPPAHTPPESPLVRALVRAWEAEEGKEHVVPGGASGASDAGIIRAAGVHTARVGLPVPETPSPYPGFSMGVADAHAMAKLTRVLVNAIVELTMKSREEVGLR